MHRDFPRIWQRVWEDRHTLLRCSDVTSAQGLGENVIEECLQQCAEIYMITYCLSLVTMNDILIVYSYPEGHLPLSSYMPHIALSLWLDCDLSPSRALHKSYMEVLRITSRQEMEHEVTPFVNDILIGTYGGEMIFDKVNGVIKANTIQRANPNYLDIQNTLCFVGDVIQHPLMLAQFSAHHTIQYVLDMLQAHVRGVEEEGLGHAALGDEYDPWKIWDSVRHLILQAPLSYFGPTADLILAEQSLFKPRTDVRSLPSLWRTFADKKLSRLLSTPLSFWHLAALQVH